MPTLPGLKHINDTPKPPLRSDLGYGIPVLSNLTGLSRIEVACNQGIAFTIAPDLALIDGIDAARNLFKLSSKGLAAEEWKVLRLTNIN